MSNADSLDIAEESAAEQLASQLKAAADPLRLLVLRVLGRDSCGVLELCHILDTKQPAMSHHLKVLARAGLVAFRREGNSIYYRRAVPGPDALLQALFAEVDALPLPPEAEDALAGVQHARAEQSLRFFVEHAERFRAQQDLIAELESYAGAGAELIDSRPGPRRRCLEVGPGEGGFLPALAARFAQVVALDYAPGMLAKARATCEAMGLATVEFVLGDTRAPALTGQRFDCAVINMVLHHVPDPAAMLGDVAALLEPGGLLLVTDLCRHDQGWAREACGDLWLGFEPAELAGWAQQAGLQEVACQFLARRNGFQIQVRLFAKTD